MLEMEAWKKAHMLVLISELATGEHQKVDTKPSTQKT